jgi:prepilin signal peptidase PulO-like enzyme (type II secretory pathway)
MEIIIQIYIFIIGMLLSSFFGVVAMRIPNKESLMGRSYCPKCHHQLRFIDILPLVGYFINKGRCRDCKETIPIIYPIIEVIGGLLFLGAYLLYGFTLSFAISAILISVLMIESISDFEQMIVIDRVWIIGIIPLIIIHIIEKNILTHLLSAFILFALLYAIAFIGAKVYKKEALGGGDIKLYIFIGFVLTWQQGLLSLFLASFFGLIFGLILKKQNKLMPLVPFIALGVIISFVFGNLMIEWYLNLLRM